ncbi:MAG: acyltransferase, partial [Planctomycetia bacterium]
MPPPDDRHDLELPPFSRRLYGWFMWYVRRYFRRHFHALRLLQDGAGRAVPPDIAGEPAIFYANHPGWWDPLTFLLLADRLYPDRLNYGPI